MSRFNPPPHWPPAPDGWTPPPGWQPDPTWGPPPDGWQLWLDDEEEPVAPRRSRGKRVALVLGGVAAGFVALLVLIVVIAVATTGDSEPAAAGTGSASAADATAASASDQRAAEAEASQAAEQERVQAEASAAAEAQRAVAEAALLDPASYVAISKRDYAALVKDPAARTGEKYVVYGHVAQFDTITGTSAFLASTAGERSREWYEYDINTMVTASDPKILADVVEDDIVKMHVTVDGAQSYETAIGGVTTVPSLQVHIVEVIGAS